MVLTEARPKAFATRRRTHASTPSSNLSPFNAIRSRSSVIARSSAKWARRRCPLDAIPMARKAFRTMSDIDLADSAIPVLSEVNTAVMAPPPAPERAGRPAKSHTAQSSRTSPKGKEAPLVAPLRVISTSMSWDSAAATASRRARMAPRPASPASLPQAASRPHAPSAPSASASAAM